MDVLPHAMDQHKAAYDFVEKPSPEFLCRVSSALLLEPYLTECCGNHLSEQTYRRHSGPEQPGWCPVCGGDLSAVLDKSVKRKVFSLKVRCPHKADGCEWEGELGSLQQHLSTNSFAGECRYVDVDCPYACGERVQRRNMEEHESQRCPLRPFTCQYCNNKATHLKITKVHWPVCKKYPQPCPNECGEEEIERQHLKEHLEQTCPLQVIQCEFGCNAQLQRRQMPAHMKENVETHLSLVRKEVPKLQNIVQQQADLIKQMASQMKQQEDRIKQQEEQVKRAFMQLQQGKPFPPMDIIMDDFEKRKKSCASWYSPPFYTHIGGYKMRLKVDAQGCLDGKGTHVSLSVYLMKGEFDNLLKWPFRGKIIIQLKNPSFVYQQILALNDDTPNEQVCKPSKEWNDHGPGNSKYISHDDLYSGGYLKDNKLVFCVCFSNL